MCRERERDSESWDMEVRRLDVTLLSAHDLKDGSVLGMVRAYAVAWLDPSSPQKSSLSTRCSHTNPVWINQRFCFDAVPESSLRHRAARLTIQIFHKSSLIFPRIRRKVLLGTASIPLMDIIGKGNETLNLISCDLVRPSGKVQGRVKVTTQVGPKVFRDDIVNEPVMAYPAFDDYIGVRPRFQCYPNSRRRLPRGYPAVPYYVAPAPSLGDLLLPDPVVDDVATRVVNAHVSDDDDDDDDGIKDDVASIGDDVKDVVSKENISLNGMGPGANVMV